MDVKAFIDRQVEDIRAKVGTEKAISALSGGVDSSVSTALAHRALGDRLVSLFIDDGLMRQDEPKQVRDTFAALGIPVTIVDKASEFFAALRGKPDPEVKRKAFRQTFYEVFGREVKASGAKFLIQGTIAPDIIETRGGVKTQHNILEQIGIDPRKEFGYRVIEPLVELYKPGVRAVAKELGLPESVYNRMPFPGPALAARVVGEVTPERVTLVRAATVIVEQETAAFHPFQAFAVLLSDKGTGVIEGQRRFGDIIVIRSVESQDAMTATASPLPWPVLTKMAARITTEVPGISRVCYELTPKPPSTIEYV